LIQSRSVQPPAVVLSDSDSASIDQELAKMYEATRREWAAA
jgi:hypothetical protein